MSEKKAYVKGVDSIWTCPSGEPHLWVYRGRKAQHYVCQRCGMQVEKAILKEETD